MVQTIATFVNDVHDEASKTLSAATDNHAAEMGRLLQLDVDLLTWEQVLSDRPESRQLADARRELGFALYAAATGQYVHAYAGLRIFLELSVASVHFSANELHRRRWLADREDFSWRRALDENEGVWSSKFVREFYEPGVTEAAEYAKVAATTYRQCSQFVHGKSSVRSRLPSSFAYSEPVLREWLTRAADTAEAVLFLIFIRYGKDLLPTDDGKLAGTLQDYFAHMPHVRVLLGLPIDEESRRGR